MIFCALLFAGCDGNKSVEVTVKDPQNVLVKPSELGVKTKSDEGYVSLEANRTVKIVRPEEILDVHLAVWTTREKGDLNDRRFVSTNRHRYVFYLYRAVLRPFVIASHNEVVSVPELPNFRGLYCAVVAYRGGQYLIVSKQNSMSLENRVEKIDYNAIRASGKSEYCNYTEVKYVRSSIIPMFDNYVFEEEIDNDFKME